jgi:CheY-like chemotaxis protein
MSKIPTVLLVAGDGLTRLLTTSGLAMYGYEVKPADSGAQALELLGMATGADRIGVLVIDLDLPGDPDGLTVARLARAQNPKLMVIYTSRMPQRIPEKQKVPGAPILRTPYYAQQIAGIIRELQQGSHGAHSERAERAA